MHQPKETAAYITNHKKDEQISHSGNEDAKITTTRLPYTRTTQNYRLIWLKNNGDVINNGNSIDDIRHLRQITNTIQTFTDIDECIDVITDIIDEDIFMIISEELAPTIVPLIDDIAHINSIYIFCENQKQNEEWIKQWSKIKGIFTRISEIYGILKKTARNCDRKSPSISLLQTTDASTSTNLDELDQSFMYTTMLKEILLTIDFNQEHIKDFLTYCRKEFFVDNTVQLQNVDRIEQEYYDRDAIWWYTNTHFLYSTLNRALRTMEVDLIIKMGFFLRDLHQSIVRLHAEQFGGEQHVNSFKVYRGQGLSWTDSDRLLKTQGGLLSFNSFLSTSLDRQLSFAFAQSNQEHPDQIGVLFEISNNPSLSSAYFANVRHLSTYPDEEEILFSMNSIFRIGQIKQIDPENDSLWQVNLTLTDDNDPHLHQLTEYIQRNTSQSETGWFKLGDLLIQLGHFTKAQQLFATLFKQTTEQLGRANIYHMLGIIEIRNGNYQEAIAHCERAIEIKQTIFPLTHLSIASSSHSISGAYAEMGEYSKALEYYEKAHKICQKSLPSTHPSLAASYNNIGRVYSDTGEHSKALEYYEKAHKIYEKSLPPTHPDLATNYNNIGRVYSDMGEYSKALEYFEKAHKIKKKSLPPTHPSFATSYSNIGRVYSDIGEHSKALEYYEKSNKIYEKSFLPIHPDLATSYNNIGRMYSDMGEYSKALEYYEKEHKIYEKSLPPTHPDLAASYNNIGWVYSKMGEYSKALEYYEKSHEIREKSLPSTHPDLATNYNNIGGVYSDMGEYSKALEYFEKAHKIKEKSLPRTHPSFATSYNNIGWVYSQMGEYSKALEYYEKSNKICQKSLLPTHPDLATSYNNIGRVYSDMREYSKALEHYEKSRKIYEKSLPPTHPSLATSYNNIGRVYLDMGEYSKALEYYEKAHKIREKSLPSMHPDLADTEHNLAKVYKAIEQYALAYEHAQRAVEIVQQRLSKKNPHLLEYKETAREVRKKL